MIAAQNKIIDIIRLHKTKNSIGITSVCSANEYVIKASIINAKKHNKNVLLIESTSNQVDQFGGYTGIIPSQFRDIVYNFANDFNYPVENIILGGDHLGPNRWQLESCSAAMEKAKALIAAYVSAGYNKIHLDTSMKCADDGNPKQPLNPKIVAERTAILCKVAEETFKQKNSNDKKPVYIIGSDVPPPGGAKNQDSDLRITPVSEVEETIELTKKEFFTHNLQEAWERVVAIVVQPGVEFGDSNIVDYQSNRAEKLSKFIQEKNNLVYEAHSTDYQKKSLLKKMVEDHFAILKVGPWLTFALREGLFSLALIEKEYLQSKKNVQLSNLIEVVEDQMIKNPKYWNKYYHGNDDEVRFKLKYSLSDRIRYYWNHPSIDNAVKKMFENLNNYKIPHSLISQFLYNQYLKLREGEISDNPEELLLSKISEILDIYNYATNGGAN
ncbi:MAG: class II D-tagatose-bisphosphate aldolase non-catalytic subunit [Ignavibacterium sp.]|uniref:class II D-tagatose-bisphosphate aldolase non-catalytic subunit n=1 Tax=Ignavibacterium sp. TaxID=2651167 RepID=UPI0040492967